MAAKHTTTVTVSETSLLRIPLSLQRQAGFKLGDRLECKATRGVITIVPSGAVVKSAAAPTALQVKEKGALLLEALDETRKSAERSGSSKMTTGQINAEIAAYRREQRQKRSGAKSVVSAAVKTKR